MEQKVQAIVTEINQKNFVYFKKSTFKLIEHLQKYKLDDNLSETVKQLNTQVIWMFRRLNCKELEEAIDRTILIQLDTTDLIDLLDIGHELIDGLEKYDIPLHIKQDINDFAGCTENLFVKIIEDKTIADLRW